MVERIAERIGVEAGIAKSIFQLMKDDAKEYRLIAREARAEVLEEFRIERLG